MSVAFFLRGSVWSKPVRAHSILADVLEFDTSQQSISAHMSMAAGLQLIAIPEECHTMQSVLMLCRPAEVQPFDAVNQFHFARARCHKALVCFRSDLKLSLNIFE